MKALLVQVLLQATKDNKRNVHRLKISLAHQKEKNRDQVKTPL